MAITVKVVCYKSKVLSNNESPLMLRVTKDRKPKYVSLGISVNPTHWDFSKNQPKTECPNREYIEMLIADKIKEYSAKIIELKATNQEFTSTSLVEKVSVKRTNRKTVADVFQEYMTSLIKSGRKSYALSIKQLYNSLLEFNHNLDFYFSVMDVAWLKRYELFLRERQLAENTIGIRFRTLRAVYNVAIEEDAVSSDCYPFKKFKVSRLHQDTVKRALTKVDIERVLQFQSSNRYMRFPIDIFTFTYYCGGINFKDIAHLTKANLIDGRLIYKRQKTKKLIKIPLQPQALALIKKYHDTESPYLFPILSPLHITDEQKANRIHKVITKVNDRLKQIGKTLNLPITLTTYVARHSQATVMKKAGVSTAVIREIMGHSSERVTQIYLDSFDNEQINEAMKNLL
ncbi:site-specific integrase [Bacteroides fragilis]|uniref:Tyrosine type site-specific recombinase n=1 Tax=Bacteroides fragilis (strain YCH46) TaxID=295405 RepID=Q64QN3_BACFR|nr:site-specific integrase [Bacteroides fragilis]MBA5657438.1 site-specific integrase [Bacteroides fragilis]MCE9295740.1 site-specific integrase [Bacteroides fragilis]MCE9313201.1 site-specific integrase [Bacteroides fragilis]MCE9323910.1 site-specific integrase [Bacteroides fragilis]MCZ2630819.1 site-specific integrase [Bacteroides fragilis]